MNEGLHARPEQRRRRVDELAFGRGDRAFCPEALVRIASLNSGYQSSQASHKIFQAARISAWPRKKPL